MELLLGGAVRLEYAGTPQVAVPEVVEPGFFANVAFLRLFIFEELKLYKVMTMLTVPPATPHAGAESDAVKQPIDTAFDVIAGPDVAVLLPFLTWAVNVTVPGVAVGQVLPGAKPTVYVQTRVPV